MAETKVELSDRFKREVNALDEKYPGALDEVVALIERLKRGERPGDRVPKVGYTVFKVRLPTLPRGGVNVAGFAPSIMYKWPTIYIS